MLQINRLQQVTSFAVQPAPSDHFHSMDMVSNQLFQPHVFVGSSKTPNANPFLQHTAFLRLNQSQVHLFASPSRQLSIFFPQLVRRKWQTSLSLSSTPSHISPFFEKKSLPRFLCSLLAPVIRVSHPWNSFHGNMRPRPVLTGGNHEKHVNNSSAWHTVHQ